MYLLNGKWVSEEPEKCGSPAWEARRLESDLANFCRPVQNKVGNRVPDAPSVHR